MDLFKKIPLYLLYFSLQSFFRIGSFFTQIPHYISSAFNTIVFYRKYIIGGLSLGLTITLSIHTYNFLRSLPHPKSLTDFHQPLSIQIYDRNSLLLYSTYSYKHSNVKKIEELPKILVNATLITEKNIPRQLVKKVLEIHDNTLQTRIKEEIVARRIKRALTQEQILKLYFNTVSYGNDTTGVENAAQRFFYKNAKDLTDKEAVSLVVLAQTSSDFEKPNKNWLEQEIGETLDRLERKRVITKNDKDKIKKEKLVIQPLIVYKRAPHAVDYVLQELKRKTTDTQQTKNILVYTTIDLPLQNYIQQAVISAVSAQKNNSLNISVLVIDSETREILSMVGSTNYFNPQSGSVNGITSHQSLNSLHILSHISNHNGIVTAKNVQSINPVIKVWVQSSSNEADYEESIRSLIVSEIANGLENEVFYTTSAYNNLLVESH